MTPVRTTGLYAWCIITIRRTSSSIAASDHCRRCHPITTSTWRVRMSPPPPPPDPPSPSTPDIRFHPAKMIVSWGACAFSSVIYARRVSGPDLRLKIHHQHQHDNCRQISSCKKNSVCTRVGRPPPLQQGGSL